MTQAQQASAPASMTVTMLGELAKDVDALHAEVLAAQKRHEEACAELERLRRENFELWAALSRYGSHLSGCAFLAQRTKLCSCGFAQAVK